MVLSLALSLIASGCGGGNSASSSTSHVASLAAGTPAPSSVPSSSYTPSGNTCPQGVAAEEAEFFPVQGSFKAGYNGGIQKLSSTTKDWAYVVDGDYPYSYWMAWYLYDSKGVPLFKIADTKIAPDGGSTNPSVDGNPILAPKRHYHIYFMPGTTPNSVVGSMKQQGKNVALLPKVGSSSNVGIVGRSYWSFANDQLGDYDRFGYGGPTHTPYPVIRAFTTDEATGQMKPVANCAAQSLVPHKLWFNPSTKKPTITFENAPRPTDAQLKRLPHWLTSTGSMTGSFGREFPPSPKPSEVQFYRNKASTAPYADVQAAPPVGDPPDGCGGYVAANLPNKVVSLVHIAQVPSYPDYRGATSKTLNQSNKFQLKFYSVVIYGWTKQIDAYGSPNNSQIGNRQVIENSDGSATVVLWPQSATGDQVNQIAAIAKANHWNILRSGLQTTAAPNMLIIREKGPNPTWKNALAPNGATTGAPCAQTADPSLSMPEDPPSAQVTQKNGMGLTAPIGQNCTIEAFTSGKCLKDLQTRMKQAGYSWSAQGGWPSQKSS